MTDPIIEQYDVAEKTAEILGVDLEEIIVPRVSKFTCTNFCPDLYLQYLDILLEAKKRGSLNVSQLLPLSQRDFSWEWNGGLLYFYKKDIKQNK